MEWNRKEYNQQKHQFKTYYCSSCRQSKPCGTIVSGATLGTGDKCCSCYFQDGQEQAQEYSNYHQVYQREVKKQQQDFQQLRKLRDYSGCSKCGTKSATASKEVDAYDLYVENKLVCQPCLVGKERGSSSPISFLERQGWYRKRWGINLTEWLTQFQCLPVNADCAREWLKDRGHLKSCRCLELETKQLVDLHSNSLKEYQQKLKKCSCEKSKKFRVDRFPQLVKKGWLRIGMTRGFEGLRVNGRFCV